MTTPTTPDLLPFTLEFAGEVHHFHPALDRFTLCLRDYSPADPHRVFGLPVPGEPHPDDEYREPTCIDCITSARMAVDLLNPPSWPGKRTASDFRAIAGAHLAAAHHLDHQTTRSTP